jgi:hypothetical protein
VNRMRHWHTDTAVAGRFGIDLHEANVMARAVGYGWQLVITDPISFPK